MNKQALVEVMSQKAELTKKDAEKALVAFQDAVTEALIEGDKVQLVGFGTFETVERKARMGRNPKTNEEIQIPECNAPKFKAGKALKDAVRGE